MSVLVPARGTQAFTFDGVVCVRPPARLPLKQNVREVLLIRNVGLDARRIRRVLVIAQNIEIEYEQIPVLGRVVLGDPAKVGFARRLWGNHEVPNALSACAMNLRNFVRR